MRESQSIALVPRTKETELRISESSAVFTVPPPGLPVWSLKKKI